MQTCKFIVRLLLSLVKSRVQKQALFLEMRPVRMGFFGDTLRKPLKKQGVPYHLAVTLIQNELQKSACLVLQYPYRTF